MQEASALKGFQKIGASLSLTAKSAGLHLTIFLLSFLVGFGGIMAALTTRTEALNAVSYHIAGAIVRFSQGGSGRHLNYLNAAGQKISFQVASFQRIPPLVANAETIHSRMLVALVVAFCGSVLAVYLSGRVLSRYHRKRKVKSSLIRGGLRVDVAEMVDFLSSQEQGKIRLGEVTLPKDKEGKHISISGDTGAGKSHLLMDVLQVLRESKKKAILLDKNGELLQHFYNPETDKILAPFDDRSVNWTPFAEGTALQDCERMAMSFIPTGSADSGNASHWIESSITVFSWLLYKMAKGGAGMRIDDIISHLTVSNAEVETDLLGNQRIVKHRGVNKLLKGTLADLVVDIDSPEHASSVMASIIPNIRALWYLRGLEDRELFSIREWLKKDEPGWLFIRVNEDNIESVKPIITAWMDTAVKGVLSLPKNGDREIWCVIDELQSLGKINALEKGLAEGRKHGLRLLLGFTSIDELFASYGEKKARAMISMCGTKVSFRVSEPNAADWTASMLGDEEVFREQTSFSVGTNDNQSFSDHKERNLLVSATEIKKLADFAAFLLLTGPYPVTEIHNKWRDRKTVAAPTVPREIPDHVDPPEPAPIEEPLELAAPKTRKKKSAVTLNNDPLI